MSAILDLSLHGSLAFLLVWILNRGLSRHMRAGGRRAWWIAVPCTFLISIPVSILPAVRSASSAAPSWVYFPRAEQAPQKWVQPLGEHASLWFILWLAGAISYFLVVLVQTRTALVRWNRARLSTDPRLLDLLEDCKQAAGITAPIGLVVSNQIFVPAIFGWLRPRILLPHNLVCSLSRDQLRAVLSHELAHFRSLDIPLNWLFTFARVVHWFNPAAHLAFQAWARFQEEAADESALRTLKSMAPASYGHVLLLAIQDSSTHASPFGALAIGESIQNLKERITMITQYPHKSKRLLLTSVILLLLIGGVIVRPIHAEDTSDPRPAAVAAMQTWLGEVDQGQFDQSWKDASASFQKAVTSAQWTSALNSVRTPLGKCADRKLASSLHQSQVPTPTGPQKGEFVIAQFNSSFENLAYAVETVTFEKGDDGTWKAAGYYIKPKS